MGCSTPEVVRIYIFVIADKKKNLQVWERGASGEFSVKSPYERLANHAIWVQRGIFTQL